MRLAFILRSSAKTNAGGDLIQAQNTLNQLNKLGHDARLVFADEKIKASDFDILHFFNLIRPADILKYSTINLPKVLSPIYVDYSEFDKSREQLLQSLSARLLGKYGSEYFKTIIRQLKNQERIKSKYYLLKGHKKSMQAVLNMMNFIVPNSHSELERIKKDLSIQCPFKVIPNGVDKDLFYYEERPRKGVLCVARFEGLKNQMNLIQAMNKLEVPTKLIGKSSDNHKAYYEACRKLAGSHIEFVDHCSQNELAEYYKSAKVHVLPSWFETTGLSSLEAAACGAIPVVSDKGDVRAYFDGIAEFCEPGSAASIEAAIKRAINREDHIEVSKKVLDNYTWKKAALLTSEVYETLLK